MVHEPLATTLAEVRKLRADKALEEPLLKTILHRLVSTLNFLHNDAKVIHTGERMRRTMYHCYMIISYVHLADIQEKNILMSLDERTAAEDCERFEQREREHPTPRKIDDDQVIYVSRPLTPVPYPWGPPILCDFGQARFGDYDNTVEIQPLQYRAPEVILRIPWDEKVDMWNLATLVSTQIMLYRAHLPTMSHRPGIYLKVRPCSKL